MKGRFKGHDISRTIGISQDGMFLGRPEFHRMGRFWGWGVSEDAAFLGQDWHFTVNLKIRGCGKWKDAANQAIGIISRSICKTEDPAFQRIRRFSIDWHFTVCKSSQDAAKHRMGSFKEWPSFRGYGVSQSIGISRSTCKSKDAAKNRMGPFIFQEWPSFSAHVLRFSYSLLIGQVFAFCNFIFRVYDTVCDWSKTLI